MVLEGGFLLTVSGGALFAHELGHNLDLDHSLAGAAPNLMDAALGASTALTSAQFATIGGSDLVIGLASTNMIKIQTVLLQTPAVNPSASPAPEPGVLALLVLAGLPLLLGRRRPS